MLIFGYLVPLLVLVLAVFVLRRSWEGRFGNLVRVAARVLGWFVVGVTGLIGILLVLGGFVAASPPAKAGLLLLAAGLGLAWQLRRRSEARSPERVVQIDRAVFLTAFGVYLATAIAWLVLGLLPALAAAFPSFADQLREWGTRDTLLGGFALRSARMARNSSSGVQVVLDYAFSV